MEEKRLSYYDMRPVEKFEIRYTKCDECGIHRRPEDLVKFYAESEDETKQYTWVECKDGCK